MSFNMLSQIDSEDNDNLDYQQNIDEIKSLITETYDVLLEETDIKIVLDIFTKYLNNLNEKIEVLEGYIDDEDIIQKVYNKGKKIYEILDDRYFINLVSKKGYKLLKEYLETDDIYYNIFSYTRKIEYIACGLKYSSIELLNQVDDVIKKESKYYGKKRYEQYIMILHYRLSNKRFNYDSMIKILELQEICKKDNDIEIYFKKIFNMELLYINQYNII